MSNNNILDYTKIKFEVNKIKISWKIIINLYVKTLTELPNQLEQNHLGANDVVISVGTRIVSAHFLESK